MNHRDVARLFGILNRQSQRYITKACAELEITFPEYLLLLNLYENEGISQDDMAKILFMDKSVITRSLKLLEAKGLVRRMQNERDKRSKHLYSTAAGKAQRVFLVAVLEKWINYLSADMDQKALEVLLDGMQTISVRAMQIDCQKN